MADTDRLRPSSGRPRLSRTRRWTVAIAIVAPLALAALFAIWQLARARCFQIGAPVVCRVDTGGRKLVALSFDDGPTRQGLDAILPVLARHRAHATFFLIGRDIDKHPGEARRLRDAGQEIGNHSYSHERMVLHGSGWYDAELARTAAALQRQGIASPRYFRPPYGKKLIGLPSAVSRAAMLSVTWDVEEPDASDPTKYARELVAQVRPGSIILIHAMYRGSDTARAALPLVLTMLEKRGYSVVTVGELISAHR